ncbi:MAG: methyltransferase domain-containing protein [Acidobacteria bacterium]|nr:methyltransferase domain-containing protein [Acidobacteriota bacterium]
MALLQQETERGVRAIEEQMQQPDLLPSTRQRCASMIEALRKQASQIAAIMQPVLPGAGQASTTELPAPLKYIHYLYRDWGWPAEPNGENERALAAMDFVQEERPLGRTLVIGAGACRLAYDLHRRDAGAETVALDIEPFLFTVARTVILGGTVRLSEANAEIDELGAVSREWTLTAPHGPLDKDRFHFLIADGLEPPLEKDAFDTVVTPWFIDIVPPDLRDFMSTVYRLLKRGGRWLNLGPLRYTPDMPAPLRFTREEVFDLLKRAGFELGHWRTESMPYLVSKLNARGKMELVLAFAATKSETSLGTDTTEVTPPAWLLFRHLPIPTFPGQSMFHSNNSLVQLVVSAIDGNRSLDDLTLMVADRARQPDLSIHQIRAAIRRCLGEIHPNAKQGGP